MPPPKKPDRTPQTTSSCRAISEPVASQLVAAVEPWKSPMKCVLDPAEDKAKTNSVVAVVMMMMMMMIDSQERVKAVAVPKSPLDPAEKSEDEDEAVPELASARARQVIQALAEEQWIPSWLPYLIQTLHQSWKAH